MAELDLFRHALSAEQSSAGTWREAVHHDVDRGDRLQPLSARPAR